MNLNEDHGKNGNRPDDNYDLLVRPDLEEVQRRARKYLRTRALTRNVSAVAAVGLAVVLSGAIIGGANGETVVSEPADRAYSSESTVPIEWPGAACDPGRRGPSAKQLSALGEILKLGRSEFRHSYSGGRACEDRVKIIIFRVKDREFDKEIKKISSGYGTQVEIRNSPASNEKLKEVSREALSRRSELIKNAADLSVIKRQPEGYVQIGVNGDVAAARRVLKDLDDLDYAQVIYHAPTRPT